MFASQGGPKTHAIPTALCQLGRGISVVFFGVLLLAPTQYPADNEWLVSEGYPATIIDGPAFVVGRVFDPYSWTPNYLKHTGIMMKDEKWTRGF